MNRDVIVTGFLLLVLLLVAWAVDAFRPQSSYILTDVGYDAASGPPYELRTPVDLPNTFDLNFDGWADDANGDNFLEASGGGEPALRFELQPPGRLNARLFEIFTPVTLTNTFALHQWHHFDVQGFQDGHFDLTLDGVTQHFTYKAIRQSQSSAEIGYKDFTFRFGRLEIGAGASPPQPLHGRIANLSFSSQYFQTMPWPAAIFAYFIVGGAVVWLLLPWLVRIRRPEITRSDVTVFAIMFVAATVGYIMYVLHIPPGKWSILLAIGAGAIAGVLAASRSNEARISPKAQALALILFVVLAGCSLFLLPNWIVTARMFWRWPLTSMFAVTFGICAVALFLDMSVRRNVPVRNSWRWLAFAPYALFVLLALRTDSVVAPINALHWDYVLGAMRAIREGGWLLWDVPSQYGFLNVLVPSLLPIHPVIDAFYWFQAVTFFVAAAAFYRTLYRVLAVHWALACVLVCAFFFLADPLLIGPSPYPSTSAVRFLWCYILLAMAASNFLGERPSVDRFARWGGLVWIVALLWSAESAIYATVIYFTPLLVSVLRDRKSPVSLRMTQAFKLVGIPIGCAMAVFVLVDVVYLLHFGHDADWSMYVDYIRSYGGGFGEVPIPFYGPIGTIVAISFGGAVAFAALRREGREGAAYAVASAFALVWIVSSYYFGRAFPIAITTLSPLLVFAIFTIIRAGATVGRSPIMVALSLPLVALGLISVFWNPNTPEVGPDLLHPNVHAWSRLPQTSPELSSLLATAGIKTSTPVVYYDNWIAIPRAAGGPYDRNWLPTPLGALEDPIPAGIRDKIIARFVALHRMSGYFVQATGGTNDAGMAQSWVQLLSQYYDVAPVSQSENYRVLRFSLRRPPNANTVR